MLRMDVTNGGIKVMSELVSLMEGEWSWRWPVYRRENG